MAAAVPCAVRSRCRWKNKSWSASPAAAPPAASESNCKVQTLAPSSAGQKVFVRSGFCWDAAEAYLFDIDGTLLNSRDAVHYFAFRNAVRQVLGIEASIDGVPVHGNTDPGILRAVLQRAGLRDRAIDNHLPQIVARMCAEVQQNRERLNPELCPSILELINYLQ